MACFLVPTAEAIVTTVTKKIIQKAEAKSDKMKNQNKFQFSEKLGWLNQMLWGGSGLLAFEHVWHGEVTPFFPFLTAATNPEDTAEMLYEMSTSGVAMAVLVTIAWLGLVIVTGIIESRGVTNTPDKEVAAK